MAGEDRWVQEGLVCGGSAWGAVSRDRQGEWGGASQVFCRKFQWWNSLNQTLFLIHLAMRIALIRLQVLDRIKKYLSSHPKTKTIFIATDEETFIKFVILVLFPVFGLIHPRVCCLSHLCDSKFKIGHGGVICKHLFVSDCKSWIGARPRSVSARCSSLNFEKFVDVRQMFFFWKTPY